MRALPSGESQRSDRARGHERRALITAADRPQPRGQPNTLAGSQISRRGRGARRGRSVPRRRGSGLGSAVDPTDSRSPARRRRAGPGAPRSPRTGSTAAVWCSRPATRPRPRQRPAPPATRTKAVAGQGESAIGSTQISATRPVRPVRITSVAPVRRPGCRRAHRREWRPRVRPRAAGPPGAAESDGPSP